MRTNKALKTSTFTEIIAKLIIVSLALVTYIRTDG